MHRTRLNVEKTAEPSQRRFTETWKVGPIHQCHPTDYWLATSDPAHQPRSLTTDIPQRLSASIEPTSHVSNAAGMPCLLQFLSKGNCQARISWFRVHIPPSSLGAARIYYRPSLHAAPTILQSNKWYMHCTVFMQEMCG